MPIIISGFGTYKNYLDWNSGRGNREYLIKLIDNNLGTEEFVLDNPNGINDFGLSLDRDPEYHGIFETTSLPLDFSLKTGGGGDFIQSAYEDKAINASVDAQIYKKNPDTNDFDLLYDYEVDFNNGSFSYESNDSGNYITVMLNQKGLVKKFTSRDEIDIDVNENESIGGVVISDVAKEDITYTGIDVYLDSEMEGLYYNYTRNLNPSQTFRGNLLVSPTYGNLISNRIGDRANLENPVSSFIYYNSSEITRYIALHVYMPYTYSIDVIQVGLVPVNIWVYYNIYNASDVLINSIELLHIYELTTTDKNGSGIINYTGDYIELPEGYRIELYSEMFGGSIQSQPAVNFNTSNGNGTNVRLVEKTLSIGDTVVKSFRSYNIALKMMRLMCDKDNCFITGYMQGMDLKNTFFTNGWLLRQYTNKNFVLKFRDLFKSLSYAEGLGLAYYAPDGRFYIRELEEFYKDELMIDFGVVKNFRKYPSEDYVSAIKAGCNQVGKYEDNQGALEFNLRYNYSLDFEVPESKDMLIPFHTDSLAFEFTRRKQFDISGDEDTQYDSDNFMVYTDGTKPVIGVLDFGFDGVETYYNERFLPKNNIPRNGGILAGLFWKESSAKIKYVSNTKDVEVKQFVYSNKADVQKYQLGEPYIYPEDQEFEAVVTLEDIEILRNELTKYGYYKCTDEDGVDHYGYMFNGKLTDSDKKIQIKGKTANINRT